MLSVFKQTQKEWSYVFYICAVVFGIGAIVFWVFCQSHLQPWAVMQEANKMEKLNDTSKAKDNETFIDDDQNANSVMTSVTSSKSSLAKF